MKKELKIYNPIKSGLKFSGKNQKKQIGLDIFIEQLYSYPLWKILYQRYGVNKSLSFFFCIYIGYSPHILHSEIEYSNNLNKLSFFFDKFKYFFDYELRKKAIGHMARIIDIMSYRGSRHRNKFPTRGQRTRSNYKTSRKYNKNWLMEFKSMLK